MLKWIVFLVLNLLLVFYNLTNNINSFAIIFAYALIGLIILFMTPIEIKKVLYEENLLQFFGVLILFSLGVFLSVNILFEPILFACKMALVYFFFAGSSYFAIKQIMQ